MAKSKFKNIALAIIAAFSFIYAGFFPYIVDVLDFLVNHKSFEELIRDLLYTIFNFPNTAFLLASLVIAIGIFTKFDKIAFTISSALFWLGSFVFSFTYFFDAIKYNYLTNDFFNEVLYIISYFTYPLAYFLMLGIGIWLTIIFFKKRETPKFLNIVIFIALAVWCLALLLELIPLFAEIPNTIIKSWGSNAILEFFVFRCNYLFNLFLQFIGFTAVAVKLADFKKRSKNTVEINDKVIVKNVKAE